jgi:hypothetical protein
MQGNFGIPNIDHLVEGVHYHIVDWDFADPAPAAPTPTPPHNPGESCPPNQKMVFGVCRRVNASGEQQVGDDTDQERSLKDQAKKEGSAFENNKAMSAGGKKYGWAMKGGKPVMVAWGSVAGEKKVGLKKPASAAPPTALTGSPAPRAGASPAPARAGSPAPTTAPTAPISATDRAAYNAGGGNAAAQRGTGRTTEQVIAQGKKIWID